MMWIGLAAGFAIGALIGGLPGAVVLGFVGWLAGLVFSSLRKPKSAPVSMVTGAPGPAARAPAGTLEARVVELETALARVERRLSQLDGGTLAEKPGSVPGPSRVFGPQAETLDIGDGYAPGTGPAPLVDASVAEAVEADATGSRADTAESVPGMTEPPSPPPPATPNPIVAWFTSGNAIARVGVVILFFGLAFLLKYAADNNMLPPELRVGGVALFGIGLLVLGWRLREKRPAFAVGLQGAAVAVLYLVTFASLRLYHLIPPEMAFFMLAAIALFSAILAITQDAVALAVIGAGGGFLAPILASSGGGSHVMLFSYYLVLNAGIAIVAYFKAWRALNLTGFLFTFLVGFTWGATYYRPELFESTQPFLVAFWAIYLLIAVLVAREDPKTRVRPGSDPGFQEAETGVRPGSVPGFRGRRYVDSTLVFGVPLAGFGLQAGLMRDTEYGLAFSALLAAAVYVVRTWGLFRTRRESWKLLAQSFLALGVVFVTLAIPLALDARWTSASWALEGAAIVWIGIRQRRTIARAFGLLLQLGAGIAYVDGYRRLPGGYPLVDAAFIGAMIVALAGLWTNRLILTAGEGVTKFERMVATPIFAWGLAWFLFAGFDEIHEHVKPPDAYLAIYVATTAFNACIAFLAVTAAAFGWLATRWSWAQAAWTARALVPALMFFAAFLLADNRHPFGHLGWLAWPAAVAAHLWILRTVVPERRSRYTTFLHAGGMLLFAFVGAMELHWIAQAYTAHHTAWSLAALATLPAVFMLVASSKAFDDRGPVNAHEKAYRYYAALALAFYFALWSLFGNLTHDASSDPLPYIPLLNAVDLAHGLVIAALATAWMALGRSGIAPPTFLQGRPGLVLGGLLAFVWLNAILLRTISHWAAIPYTTHAMARSVLVQASLSVFWAVLALAAMVYATRTSRRALWMVGMGLMVAVVAKLFLVDLSNVGGIERIVSFIAVGVLMLVIGYFSPVPPRNTETAP